MGNQDPFISAQLNLADKARALADYWSSQTQFWDNQIKQLHDVVLFCRKQRRGLSEKAL